MKWISCKDKLPPQNEEVFVIKGEFSKGSTIIAFLAKRIGKKDDGTPIWERICDECGLVEDRYLKEITHWMSLLPIREVWRKPHES